MTELENVYWIGGGSGAVNRLVPLHRRFGGPSGLPCICQLK
jgi:hypothetical protein